MQANLGALPALYLADTPEGIDAAYISSKAFPIVSSMVLPMIAAQDRGYAMAMSSAAG